ncbi:MAG: type I DNA topoisomerase [Bdellovibrionales bacterium]|nr:type I DNA topoisomerase [Bdellovibrionales bacterium]
MAAKTSTSKTKAKAAARKGAESETVGGKTLVVVESPTKAKTIRKFLGKDYIVESCMGHIRDLPQSSKDIPEKYKKQKWAQLGVDTDNEFEPIYCVPKNKTKVVTLLKDKLKQVDRLLLATDEDREGESISWHLVETLKPQVPFRRMVFNEITKDAIVEALDDTREINANLVRAQEARRILDRLVGYTISPLLWKKVAYGLSAGRVQSVAVRLIVEREHERIRFKKSSYWDIESANEKDAIPFASRLVSYEGRRVATGKDFDSLTGKLAVERAKDTLALDEKAAVAILNEIKSTAWKVLEAEEKPMSRKPPAPFITSTLQQEANRKLGLSAREAMQVAQSLYEQGFITYMRTDSTFLSTQALEAARGRIEKLYGKEYLPEAPRTYEDKKSKGAQEAHEAIRPAGTEMIVPEETGLSGLPLKLYDLIWKRTIASQMVNSRQRQLSVRFEVGKAVFATSGMTIEFPGFLRAYVEGSDDEAAALEEKEVRLPSLKKGDAVKCSDLETQGHETKPPARFTEASLVQTMEREGIGRPSTYASIIGTIIDRGYVRKAGNALVPTFTAMVVAKLLRRHLPEYVDLQFTSGMENSLDEIAQGDLDSIGYLKSIYFGKDKKSPGLKPLVDKQEAEIDPAEARSIELEGLKGLSFRVGRYGAYVCRDTKEGEQCASIPDAQAPSEITPEIVNKLIDQKLNGSDALGKDPKTGLPIYVLTGSYGPYVQLGEVDGDEAKPKRVSLPAGMEPEAVTLERAIQLVELPKTLGAHPGTGKDIKAGLGRFGPYVVHDGDFRSIPKGESLFEVTLERALELLAKPKQGRGRAAALKEIEIPGREDKIQVFSGKYGPYVKLGKVNASLPEGMKPEEITFEQAMDLIRARGGGDEPAAGGAKKTKASKAKAKSPAKAAGKKTAAQKTGKKTAPKDEEPAPAPKPKAKTIVRKSR